MTEYAGFEIRAWYKTQLTGITVDGRTIPIYNYPDYEKQPPFICLVNQSQQDYATKDKRDFIIKIYVQVYTANNGGFDGDRFADLVTNEIMKRINGNYGSTENFQIVTTKYDANESYAKIDAVSGIILRQIAFSHFISKQLNNS